jgi:hypothetical protein
MQDEEMIETGLAGLTVTVTDTVTDDPIAAASAPQPAVAVTPVPADDPEPARALSVAATPMPDGWTLHKVAALVSDVAQNMYELPYILKKHELTAKQYATLEKNPFFQRALEAEVITWASANSIQKRLMLEAAIASEAAMPSLAARLQSNTEPLGEIVMLMKLFAEIAGVTGSKVAAGPQSFGEKFKIIINLGGDTLQKEASPVMKVIEQAPNG